MFFSKPKYLIVFGKGNHSKVVCEAASLTGYKPICLDDTDFLSQISLIPPKTSFIIAIGDNRIRENRFNQLLGYDLESVSIIHPSSNISPSAFIGTGVYIGPSATIAAETLVDIGCIISMNVAIDHNCTIGPFSNLAPGVALSHDIEMGSSNLIEIGSCIIPEKTIGCNVLVEAGSTVVTDIPSYQIFAGSPAVFKKSVI